MRDFTDVRTARLRLTALSPADLEDFHRLHHDPALYEHAPHRRHPDLAHSAAVLEGLVADWEADGLGYWLVRPGGGGPVIGCAGVRRNPWSWNVYYRFDRSAWGRGYAVEVLRAAAAAAAELDPAAELQAEVRPGNDASAATARRLGLLFGGTHPDVAGDPHWIFSAPATAVAGATGGEPLSRPSTR